MPVGLFSAALEGCANLEESETKECVILPMNFFRLFFHRLPSLPPTT